MIWSQWPLATFYLTHHPPGQTPPRFLNTPVMLLPKELCTIFSRYPLSSLPSGLYFNVIFFQKGLPWRPYINSFPQPIRHYLLYLPVIFFSELTTDIMLYLLQKDVSFIKVATLLHLHLYSHCLDTTQHKTGTQESQPRWWQRKLMTFSSPTKVQSSSLWKRS